VSSTRRKPAARWPQSETTKRQVLDAARALFAERGYDDTSINDIVERSGISVGSIYHQFGGKLEVFMALAGEIMHTHAEASTRASRRAAKDAAATPLSIYVAGAHAYLMSTWKDREITRLLIGDDGPPGYSVMRRQAIERFMHGTEGLTLGDPPLPDSTAYAVTGLLQAAALQIVQIEDRPTAKRVADYFVGLLARLFDTSPASRSRSSKA
jgi:AcrR family transcriptional regulator